MRKVLMISVTLLGVVLGSSQAAASNLVQIYNQAVKNDQSFQQAESTFLANKQLTPIARAALLPQIDITAGYSPYNYKYGVAATKVYGSYNSFTYGLQLTQPLFNLSNWQALSGAKSTVKAAEAKYFSSSQDLIYNTAKAYFVVLQAADTLRYTLASAKAFLHQLQTQQAKYKVGLVAITDVYNAQSQYDAAVAQEIADRSTVSNALEALRVITGHEYKSLQTITGEVPLIPPQPNNISMWVQKAVNDNYLIKAAEYTTLADKSKIKQSSWTRMPTVAAGVGFNETQNSNLPISGSKDGRLTTVGFNLDFKPYQGGLVGATVKQDRYNYLADSAALELQHRNVTSQARKSFLGVVSGISQLKSDLVSIESFRKNYESTQASFIAGTRTEVNVLQSLSDLYQAQTAYTKDEYNYILSSLQLKQAAGTLSMDDLVAINKWLKATLTFKPRGDGNYTVIFPQEKANAARSDELPTVPGYGSATSTSTSSSKSSKQKTTAKQNKPTVSTNKSAALQSFYTIQLFASNYERSAVAFKKHLIKAQKYSSLQDDSIFIVSKRAGKYKVTYGKYALLSQAKSELKKLPKSLADLRPWITHAEADNVVGSAVVKTPSLTQKAVITTPKQPKKWPLATTAGSQSWPIRHDRSEHHKAWPLHGHSENYHKSNTKAWPLPAPGSYRIPSYNPATSSGWPLNGHPSQYKQDHLKSHKAWPLSSAGSYKFPQAKAGNSSAWPLSKSASGSGDTHSANQNGATPALPSP